MLSGRTQSQSEVGRLVVKPNQATVRQAVIERFARRRYYVANKKKERESERERERERERGIERTETQ